MSRLNPPLLENTLPAFVKDAENIGQLKIPFQLNRSVGATDFDKIQVLIKSVQSNAKLYDEQVEIAASNLNGVKGYIQVLLDGSDSNNFIPIVGQYYKIQIAFVHENEIGYYSNVGVIKCISEPIISIKNNETVVANMREYTGLYQGDISEKVYSYKFNLYDEIGNIIETSGEQIHNIENDEMPTESCDIWTITRALEPNYAYSLGYSVTTINGYKTPETIMQILEVNTAKPILYADLSILNNFESGCYEIYLVGDQSGRKINGSFVILRSSSEDNYCSWVEICRYQLSSWDSNTKKLICKDYCVQQGHKYKYAIQAYNSSGLYSDKVENIEGPVLCDFEDCFLYDGEKQLKIRFNSKIGNFKSTVLETKVDTLGGKYPFVFRNGNVEYKEFSISGLLSLLSDENKEFFESLDSVNTFELNSLNAEAYRLERDFKMQALSWLNNGKIKLFRSPAEGNFIVRLINVSLTPQDSLGRLLHTFNATAYEIEDYNYANLKNHNFMISSETKIGNIKHQQINLLTAISDANGYITLEPAASFATLKANPKVSFEYTLFGDDKFYKDCTNLNGIFKFSDEILNLTPLSSIKLISDSWGDNAILTYGYYNSPDSELNYIESINIIDQEDQWFGLGLDTNLFGFYEDIRTQIGRIHYLKFYKKSTEWIDYNEETQQYKVNGSDLLTNWNKKCLYLYSDPNTGKTYYIDGNNPPELINAANNKYNRPEQNMLIETADKNIFNFNINNIVRNINETNELEFNNLSSIYKISCGRGVYADIIYQKKEITYTIESSDENIKSKKQNWISAKQTYENSQTETNKRKMEDAYNDYLISLEEYIQKELEE